MTTWGLASAGTLVALTSGCAIQHQNAPAAALGAGWQCLATASELDAPGTIFRRDDRSGAAFGTIDLSKEAGIHPTQLVVGRATSQFVTSVRLAANLLKLGKGVTGTDSATLSSTYPVSAEYPNALKEVLSDADADRARKWFATYAARETGFTYFLIREALVAQDLSYTLGPHLIAALGGEATVGQQLTTSLPNPEGNRTRPYVLQVSFEKPSHVCFRAERLRQAASGADGSASYDLVPVETPLEISSYKSME
jgi:hypothetical protein